MYNYYNILYIYIYIYFELLVNINLYFELLANEIYSLECHFFSEKNSLKKKTKDYIIEPQKKTPLAVFSPKNFWISIGRVSYKHKSFSFAKVILVKVFAVWSFFLGVCCMNHLSSCNKTCWILLTREILDSVELRSQITLITCRLSDNVRTLSCPCLRSKSKPSNVLHSSTTRTKNFYRNRL